ncbi:hypothetical protein [Streptomyces luteireticuli]|uniref:hypothetical protein n=1 Tax=Streptomyces luteireticuli TaxID=173858 RepID=UPI0035584948
MRKTGRRVLVPALAAASLTLAACSPSGTHRTAAAEDVPREKPPLVGSTEWQLGPDPTEPAPRSTTTAPADGDRTTAAARPKADPDLKVASFDSRTGRAVLSFPPPASPAPGRGGPVRTGDLIASPPVAGAPGGVLAEVVEVLRRTAHGAEVRTVPATLDAVLGDARTSGEVSVDPSAIKVSPLVPGVRVSRPAHGDRTGPGGLRVDVDTALAPGKDAEGPAAATVTGFVRLAPRVGLSYEGGTSGGGPKAASLALSGDWTTGWKLKGRPPAAHGRPLRVPFAQLHADPVLSVAGIPVVVNLDLTCYALIDADGKTVVDIQQSEVKGDSRIGGSYRADRGWTPDTKADFGTSPVKAAIDGPAAVKSGLGTEVSLGLYGRPVVTADLSTPYVRTKAGDRAGAWKLFGGTGLQGSLLPQLKVFGTPEPAPGPLPGLRHERQLARGTGAVRFPLPRDGQEPPPDGELNPADRIPARPGPH